MIRLLDLLFELGALVLVFAVSTLWALLVDALFFTP